jgi:hypothetical protein
VSTTPQIVFISDKKIIPQVAEGNSPRLTDVAGVCLLYSISISEGSKHAFTKYK